MNKVRNLIDWTCASNMYLIILIGFVILNCGNHGILASGDLPCDFLDSMNITDGKHYSNRTISYLNYTFPFGQYAQINYTFDNKMKRLSVVPYTRGCICNRKPCIRFCQPYDSTEKIDVYAENYDNKSVGMTHADHIFAFIHGHPCESLHAINAYFIFLQVLIFI